MDKGKSQLLNKNRAAIAQLHETLYPRVVRYIAVRIGDFAEAEDLGSEVFVRATCGRPVSGERGPDGGLDFPDRSQSYGRSLESSKPETESDAPPSKLGGIWRTI